MNKDNKIEESWYNNPSLITSYIIIIIVSLLICSQSFAVASDISFQIFSSVINHNTSYLFLLFYFISIKTNFGKKNFNYFNIMLIFIYLILSFTSFLTIIQSFSFNTILTFLKNLFLLIYLFHTMFRDTNVWKEFKLEKSPFNEISNDFFFSTIFGIVTLLLIVNLFSTVVVSGLIVSVFDSLFIIAFSRYIYLYRDYLDDNCIDSDNSGNFDSIKATLNQEFDNIKNSLNTVKSDLVENDMINNVSEHISDLNESIKDKIDNVSEIMDDKVFKNDIDDSSSDKNIDLNKRKKSTKTKKKDKGDE